MSNLSKVFRVLLTTVVLVALSAATYFAYSRFLKKPNVEVQNNLVVLHGTVTNVSNGIYTLEANQETYDLYVDKYSYVALSESHPQKDYVTEGYISQANVNALEVVSVGSELQVTGVIDGTSTDFMVKSLHIVK